MRLALAAWIVTIALLTAACTMPVPPEGAPVSVRPEPSAPPRAPAPVPATPPPTEPPPVVIHVVTPGQTLWRIARAYGVDPARLAEANGIADPARVEVGTALRIPGARTALEVPPYPMPVPEPPPLDDRAVVGGDAASGLLWPVEGGEVLSTFGARRRSHRHAGIDIRGTRGQEVRAARTGRVAYAGKQRGYGNVVIVDHGDGMETVYAHADTLLTHEGELVERGQPIARVGRSGNASTDHLHFEVRRDGTPIDPSPHLESIAEVRR